MPAKDTHFRKKYRITSKKKISAVRDAIKCLLELKFGSKESGDYERVWRFTIEICSTDKQECIDWLEDEWERRKARLSKKSKKTQVRGLKLPASEVSSIFYPNIPDSGVAEMDGWNTEPETANTYKNWGLKVISFDEGIPKVIRDRT